MNELRWLPVPNAAPTTTYADILEYTRRHLASAFDWKWMDEPDPMREFIAPFTYVVDGKPHIIDPKGFTKSAVEDHLL